MGLIVENLSVRIGATSILKEIDFTIAPGERFAILGESGAGKTLIAMSILRLLPRDSVLEGRIYLGNDELTTRSEPEMERVRGRRIGMVFEQPWSSLNPVFSCGSQIAHAVRLHHRVTPRAARERATDLIERVGLPRDRYSAYPRQMSGGMQQRIAIALALAGSPELIIADEPGTALDPARLDRISHLFERITAEIGAALLLITHQLALARSLCANGAVLYAGEIVEMAAIPELLDRPRHPYTQALRAAIIPEGFRPIPGTAPEFSSLPHGCRFQLRCPFAVAHCEQPQQLMNGSRCWRS